MTTKTMTCVAEDRAVRQAWTVGSVVRWRLRHPRPLATIGAVTRGYAVLCVCVSCVNSLTMCDLIRTDVDLRWLSGQIGTDLITCARLVNGASVIS